jgi:transposase
VIAMLAPEIRYVVGIDVAKRTHTLCALDAQTGKVQLRPRTIAATAAGYAEVCALLQTWGEPQAVLVGLEATGCLWEPLYEALTQAGYSVLVLNRHRDRRPAVPVLRRLGRPAPRAGAQHGAEPRPPAYVYFAPHRAARAS